MTVIQKPFTPTTMHPSYLNAFAEELWLWWREHSTSDTQLKPYLPSTIPAGSLTPMMPEKESDLTVADLRTLYAMVHHAQPFIGFMPTPAMMVIVTSPVSCVTVRFIAETETKPLTLCMDTFMVPSAAATVGSGEFSSEQMFGMHLVRRIREDVSNGEEYHTDKTLIICLALILQRVFGHDTGIAADVKKQTKYRMSLGDKQVISFIVTE